MNRSAMIGNVKLLDNTRKIERLLHNNDTGKVVFNDICRVMSDVLESNILVISKKGKVLWFGEFTGIPALSELITDQVGTFIDSSLNERFLGVLSTNENVNLGTLGFVREEDCDNEHQVRRKIFLLHKTYSNECHSRERQYIHIKKASYKAKSRLYFKSRSDQQRQQDLPLPG